MPRSWSPPDLGEDVEFHESVGDLVLAEWITVHGLRDVLTAGVFVEELGTVRRSASDHNRAPRIVATHVNPRCDETNLSRASPIATKPGAGPVLRHSVSKSWVGSVSRHIDMSRCRRSYFDVDPFVELNGFAEGEQVLSQVRKLPVVPELMQGAGL